MPDRLTANQQLNVNDHLDPPNGKTRLIMQSDGNLVLYRQDNAHALWASNTWNQPVTHAIMQSDGNLVCYDAGNGAHWATGTNGHPGSYVVLQDDGNLVVYGPDGTALWASNTVQSWGPAVLTSWTRLEPVSRDLTLTDGLQACTADPCWLLARQVAFGEFTGMDAGSPVSARLQTTLSALTRFRPGTAPMGSAGAQMPARGTPLEVTVEAAASQGAGVAPLDAAQAGRHYLRLLELAAGVGDLTQYRTGLLTAFPFPPPVKGAAGPTIGQPPAATATDPRLSAYAGRVPDGAALYQSLQATMPGGALPAAPPLGSAVPAVVRAVAARWLSWYQGVHLEGVAAPPTWDPGRLEYGVAVAAPGPGRERVLTAGEYTSGSLDWTDFDLQPADATVGAVASDLPQGFQTQAISVTLPSPVTYPGMPSPRFWTFEDAAVDFGAVTAAAESVTTSLMIEFALRYGNDHWMIPVTLDLGTVCRIDSLVVTDAFGRAVLVRPVSSVDGAAGPFRLFEHAIAGTQPGGARDPLFVLFPTLDQVLTAPPLEEVHYLRDEIADLVWAVERTAPGANGLPVDRTQAELTVRAAGSAAALTPPSNDGTPPVRRRYLLRTDVPGNWFPFLPPDDGSAGALVPGVVQPLDPSAPVPVPWGRLLAEQHAGIPPEEVTRGGAQATRAWRYARWIDGRQVTWIGRKAGPGKGPGASGLRFDLAL